MSPQKISVNEAISKGIWYIKIPSFLIFGIVVSYGIYYCEVNNLNSYFIVIFVILGIALLIVFSIFAIPKWKVWAFGNVRNVNELKTKALSQNIINADKSWVSKAEFFGRSDKRKWEEIQKKFLIPDEVNYSKIPNSINIYNSKFKLLVPVVLWSVFIILVIILMVSDRDFLGFGFMFLTAFGMFLYFDILNFNNRKVPALTINGEGIKSEENFYKWDEIRNERLYTSYGYKSLPYHHLVFNLVKNDDLGYIGINSIKMKRKELLDLIINFRSRYESENKF